MNWLSPLSKRKITDADTSRRWRRNNPEKIQAYKPTARLNDKLYRRRVRAELKERSGEQVHQ